MKRRQHKGFSLIEILVAIAIGSILMAGVIQIFISTRQSYTVIEDASRLQEAARFAFAIMAHDIREAGYTGCSTGTLGSATNTLNNADDLAYNFTEGIRGFEYVGTNPGQTYTIADANPSACGAGCADNGDWTSRMSDGSTEDIPVDTAQYLVPGSDVFVVRGAYGGSIPLVDPFNNSAQLFALNTSTPCPDDLTSNTSGICDNDILVVSDCSKSRIFQTTNTTATAGGGAVNVVHGKATATPGNAISSWGGASAPDNEQFLQGSEIVKLQSYTYFIGQDEDTDAPALFRRSVANAPQVLAENVESMQLLYGEDTNDDDIVDIYRAADSVADFDKVMSVKLSLLLRSERTVAPEVDTDTYSMAAATINPVDDNYLRRTFTTVVKLRNRGLDTDD